MQYRGRGARVAMPSASLPYISLLLVMKLENVYGLEA